MEHTANTPVPKENIHTPYRNYVFTLNNPQKHCATQFPFPRDVTTFHPFRSCIRYLAFQLELSSTGTPHYQGYIEFLFPRSIVEIKTQFEWFQKARFFSRKGTSAQAAAYALKEDTRNGTQFIYGTPSKQGARTDLEDCKAICDASLMDAEQALRNLSQDYYGNFLRYHKGFARYLELHRPSIPHRTSVHLTLILGPPGAGKSTWARQWCQTHLLTSIHYPYKDDWWNGYHPYKTQALILDEFHGQVEPSVLNQLCDVDPISLNVKYDKPQPANFTHVFLISNSAPRRWWSSTHQIPLHSLYRRIDRLRTHYLPFGQDDQDHKDITSTNDKTIVCPVIMAELIKFQQYN